MALQGSMPMAWTSSKSLSMAKMQALSCGHTLRRHCQRRSLKVHLGSCLLCHNLHLLTAYVASVCAHVKVQLSCAPWASAWDHT